jgi:hypothetical protein
MGKRQKRRWLQNFDESLPQILPPQASDDASSAKQAPLESGFMGTDSTRVGTNPQSDGLLALSGTGQRKAIRFSAFCVRSGKTARAAPRQAEHGGDGRGPRARFLFDAQKPVRVEWHTPFPPQENRR